MKDVSLIVNELKTLIDREGLDYLNDYPDKACASLLNSDCADKFTALVLLSSFRMDIPAFMEKSHSDKEILEHIKSMDFYSENVCALLTKIYSSLFSDENRSFWKKNEFAGVKAFLKSDFDISWNGSSVWSCNQGDVGCDYNAQITLRPEDEACIYKSLDKELRCNPFLSEDCISEIFYSSLTDYLNRKFDYYCTADDYYPPVAEDFEVDSYVEEWGKKNGFKVIKVDGSGETGEFISNY